MATHSTQYGAANSRNISDAMPATIPAVRCPRPKLTADSASSTPDHNSALNTGLPRQHGNSAPSNNAAPSAASAEPPSSASSPKLNATSTNPIATSTAAAATVSGSTPINHTGSGVRQLNTLRV